MSIELKEKHLDDVVFHFAHVPEAHAKMPLFLFHGGDPQFNGWHVWKENLEALARFFHPHSLDLVGYGKSRLKTSGASRLGASEQARFVLKLIESYDIHHFALGGLSWGASVANEVIKLARDRVKAVLLVSPALSPESLSSELKKGNISTIIVACPQDPVVPVSRSKRIHEAIPRSTFITIDAPEGTEPLARSHHIQSLCPMEFNENVSAVLNSIFNENP